MEAFISLDLRCSSCGRVSAYDVCSVFINPKKMEGLPVVGDRLHCKVCGRLTCLEPTTDACCLLSRAYDEIQAAASAGAILTTPLHLVDLPLKNGTQMSPAEAITHYRKTVVRNPRRLKSLLDLGKCYAGFKRFRRANSCFRRCLVLEPACAEASLAFARILELQGATGKAFAVLADSIQHLERWRFYRLGATTPAQFGCVFAKRYNRLRRWAGKAKLPALHPCFLENRFRRVGRNDACPCGNGKKFKNCCGKGL